MPHLHGSDGSIESPVADADDPVANADDVVGAGHDVRLVSVSVGANEDVVFVYLHGCTLDSDNDMRPRGGVKVALEEDLLR